MPGVDFSITQFVRNLGLEHLMDIFEREQVNSMNCFAWFGVFWNLKGKTGILKML